MQEEKFQQELTIIRSMIERTRRETFEAGYIFIIPGAIFLIAVLVMGTLELTGHAQLVHQWDWLLFPLLFGASIFSGIWEGLKMRSQPKTYTRSLFGHLWGACGLVIIISIFAIPHMNAYTPAAPLLIIGIGFYVTGVIYELPLVQASGVIWWIGICALGFVEGAMRLPIWLAVIFFGFILPGIMLNRQYRRGGADRGA